MKIAVIGVGNVGGTLGRCWAERGHDVMFGVRNSASPKVSSALKQAGGNARAGSIAEAAKFGEVVVLATPWSGARDAIQQAGQLDGKVLLDPINPLKSDFSGLDVPPGSSAAEQLQTWAPKAKVVKIFNCTGANNMENPSYPGGAATMFYCGDDAAAKATAGQLARDLGFEALDAGGLASARMLEPLALLWVSLAFNQGLGREFAFKVMRR